MMALRLIPSRRLADVTAQSICVLKPSSFGDIVQSLPLLPALRHRFPRARVSWVVKREWADLLIGHPDLDEVILFDSRGSWRVWLRLLGELRRRRFDLVFDLQGLLRTGLMTLATGAALRVGLETAREGARLACNCVVPDTGWFAAAHARYARVIRAIGAGGIGWPTVVGTAESDRQWACSHLAGPGGLRVALHPGATWPTKQWPLNRFAAVARRAQSQYNATIVLLGGKNEFPLAGEIEVALRSTPTAGRVLNLAGQSSLKQLAALLTEVDLLVTNDSGPMHLAAGLGTPVLGIFTCTSPHRSGPPGDNHELVSTHVACAASYRKRCPHRGSLHQCCHQELDARRVWQALERLVAKNRFLRHAA